MKQFAQKPCIVGNTHSSKISTDAYNFLTLFGDNINVYPSYLKRGSEFISSICGRIPHEERKRATCFVQGSGSESSW